jgi:hypothetical protein
MNSNVSEYIVIIYLAISITCQRCDIMTIPLYISVQMLQMHGSFNALRKKIYFFLKGD